MAQPIPADPSPHAAGPHSPNEAAAAAGARDEQESVALAETSAEEPPALAESPLDDDGGDVAFSESLPPETARFGEPSAVEPCCEWCNARLPQPDAARCPSCGALLQPLNGDTEVPGLTTISSAARAAAERAERQRVREDGAAGAVAAPLSQPPSRDVYEPPSDEVMAAMREIEREVARADALRDVEPGPLATGEQEEPG